MTAGVAGGLAVGLAATAAWLLAESPMTPDGRLAKAGGRLPPTAVPFRELLIRLRHTGSSRPVRLTIAAAALGAAWIALVPSLVLTITAYVLIRRWNAGRRVSAQTRERTRDVSSLRALTAELRSGLPPAEALQAAGDSSDSAGQGGIAARMVAAAASDALGGDAAHVLSDGAEPGSPAAALGAAWAVCQQTGARLAAPVSRIAAGAAADLRTAREADAALAGARSSAHLLAALPVVGVGLGALSGTGSIHVLVGTGVGQLCLVIGVALDLAGLAWLDRLAATDHA